MGLSKGESLIVWCNKLKHVIYLWICCSVLVNDGSCNGIVHCENALVYDLLALSKEERDELKALTKTLGTIVYDKVSHRSYLIQVQIIEVSSKSTTTSHSVLSFTESIPNFLYENVLTPQCALLNNIVVCVCLRRVTLSWRPSPASSRCSATVVTSRDVSSWQSSNSTGSGKVSP